MNKIEVKGGCTLRKSFISASLYGFITIIVIVVVCSFILALLIRFTALSEIAYTYITIGIGVIALFLGGLIAGIKGKTNGLLIGACTGMTFTLLTFLVQYLGYDLLFSLKQSMFHLLYVVIAICGSIVGVNLVQAKQ